MCDNMIIDDWKYFRSRAKNILNRCNNPSSEKDKTYKIKNIKCLLGKTTKEIALNLMKVEGYEYGLQLDRIDNNGNYELKNLRWVSPKENCMNRDTTRSLEYYSIKPIDPRDFKKMCKKRGLTYSDFYKIRSNEKFKNGVGFIYKYTFNKITTI